MKVLDNLIEMRAYMSDGACAPMRAVLQSMADFIEGPPECASFTALLGAPAYLIERVDELAEVVSAEEGNGGYVSLADGPSAWFDIAEWIDGGSFARFATIVGPEGGPQYLVPKRIADQAESVALSIELTAARS